MHSCILFLILSNDHNEEGVATTHSAFACTTIKDLRTRIFVDLIWYTKKKSFLTKSKFQERCAPNRLDQADRRGCTVAVSAGAGVGVFWCFISLI